MELWPPPLIVCTRANITFSVSNFSCWRHPRISVDIQARTQHQGGVLVFHCTLLMCPSVSDCQQQAPLKHPEAFLGDNSAQTTLNVCTCSLHVLFLATSKIFADFWACWSDSCSFIISSKVNFVLKGSCLACGQNRTSWNTWKQLSPSTGDKCNQLFSFFVGRNEKSPLPVLAAQYWRALSRPETARTLLTSAANRKQREGADKEETWQWGDNVVLLGKPYESMW